MTDTAQDLRLAEANARAVGVDLGKITDSMWRCLKAMATVGYWNGNHNTFIALAQRGLLEGYNGQVSDAGRVALERYRSGNLDVLTAADIGLE